MIIEKTTIDERYIEAVQQLAAVRIQLKMAMKLLLEAQPAATGAAAERWKMQLDGLREEVTK
jgi:DNA-binding FrmR family transcriptional regulator